MIFRLLFANGKKYGNVSNILPQQNKTQGGITRRPIKDMPSPVAERLLEEDIED
jgi:hypothetical protein